MEARRVPPFGMRDGGTEFASPGAGRNIPGGGRVMPQLIDYRIGRLQPARARRA